MAQELIGNLSRTVETVGLLDIFLNLPESGKVGDVRNIGPLQEICGCIQSVTEAGIAGKTGGEDRVVSGDCAIRELYVRCVIKAAIFQNGSVPIAGKLPPVVHDIGAVSNTVLAAGHVL